MIIFRPQRGSLAESMAEAQEFNNVEEMKKHIVNMMNDKCTDSEFSTTADDIVIEDLAVNDPQIGWEDSKNVCVKFMFDKCYLSCIGICATKYRKNN